MTKIKKNKKKIIFYGAITSFITAFIILIYIMSAINSETELIYNFYTGAYDKDKAALFLYFYMILFLIGLGIGLLLINKLFLKKNK